MKHLFVSLMLVLSGISFAAETVPIVAYHRITNALPPSQTVISESRFASHIQMLKDEGFNPIRIDDLVRSMRSGTQLPTKSIVITFDDGWKDQLLAVKLLEANGFSAMFYLTSGAIDGTQYLSSDDVRRIASNPLFEIGAHSHTHFPEVEGKDHSTLEPRLMIGEMVLSRLLLEKLLQRPVHHYAWPFGYATLETVQAAEISGFSSSAMINGESKNSPGRTMELQRLNIDGRCPAASLKRMLETGKLEVCDDEKTQEVVSEFVR